MTYPPQSDIWDWPGLQSFVGVSWPHKTTSYNLPWAIRAYTGKMKRIEWTPTEKKPFNVYDYCNSYVHDSSVGHWTLRADTCVYDTLRVENMLNRHVFYCVKFHFPFVWGTRQGPIKVVWSKPSFSTNVDFWHVLIWIKKTNRSIVKFPRSWRIYFINVRPNLKHFFGWPGFSLAMPSWRSFHNSPSFT